MKSSLTYVWISILTSGLIAFLIWSLLVGSANTTLSLLEDKYNQTEINIRKSLINFEVTKKQKEVILADPQKIWSLTRHLLKSGFEEAALMKQILGCTENCSDKFSVKSFEVFKPFFMESKNEENQDSGQTIDLKNMASVDLDEYGMPKGAEVDDGSWKGVEIVPIKMTFVTSFKSFAEFFRNMKTKKLPLHIIRSLDMIFIDSDRVNGTLIISFPLAENIKL